MKTTIKYYGTRGSVPVPSRRFVKYGGNTTSLFLKFGDTCVFIDAGSGIRLAGHEFLSTQDLKEINKLLMFFTHTHWDHIQGFPFFLPAYLPKFELDIYGEKKTVIEEDRAKEVWDVENVLNMQQHFMCFPISVHQMQAKKTFHELKGGQTYNFPDFTLKTVKMYHPNDTLGFRFDFEGGSFCFCTDVEHNDEMIKILSEFAAGVDVLAYDSQYHQREYENSKKGWGHSTYQAGTQIALEAGVQEFQMIHHDPNHDDSILESMEVDCKRLFKNSLAVTEGHIIKYP